MYVGPAMGIVCVAKIVLLVRPNGLGGIEKVYQNGRSVQFKLLYVVNLIILVNLSQIGFKLTVSTKCDDNHFIILRMLVFSNFFQTMLISGARNRKLLMNM